jgi:hypothetical protein
VKALTVRQPWATLIVTGRKRIETRSWPTGYRGILAIHAGKSMSRDEVDYAAELVEQGLLDRVQQPLGAILGTVRLHHCLPTEAVVGSWSDGGWITVPGLPGPDPEDELGDFSPGRFAWLLADAVRLVEPVPARGRLSLWDWEP